LRQTWENALLSAWDAAGLAKPDYTLEMPYYGNLLARLAVHARGVVPCMRAAWCAAWSRIQGPRGSSRV
jgi:hypothetical protein